MGSDIFSLICGVLLDLDIAAQPEPSHPVPDRTRNCRWGRIDVSNIKRSYIWPITRILRVMALFTCDITRKHAITRPHF